MFDRKGYMRIYQRAWLAARRASYFRGKRCAACGSRRNLELDHLDRKTKSYRLRGRGCIWSFSQVRFKAEIAKCQVLCRSCHRKKTGRENWTRTHGAAAMYQNHKCRCRLCRKYKQRDNARRYGK